jgi:hypothetical protein
MQKAALDEYLQLKLRNEMARERQVREILSNPRPGQYDALIKKALFVLREPAETGRMKQLREEAGKLGEETNELHGDRNLGYFKLDRSLRDLPRVIDRLEAALKAKSDEEKKTALKSALD